MTLVSSYRRGSLGNNKFLKIEHLASVSLNNIESDVLSFISKNGPSDKSEKRLQDVENIRSIIDHSSVVGLRMNNMARHLDHIIDELISSKKETESLKKEIQLIKKNIGRL